MRKLLYGLIGLVVLVVAVALVAPSFIDWNDRKGEIAERVKEATGREIHIDGDLDLTVLPSPRLSAENVRLANVAGATAPDMIKLRALRLRVRLMPLLSGRIELASVALIEPVIELERLADGRVNWDLGAAAPAAADSGSAATDDRRDDRATAGTSRDAIRLDSLRIVDGTLIYRDTPRESVERIAKLNAEISAGSLAGPFGIEGHFTARGMALAVAASVGRIAGADAAPIQLEISLPEAGTEIELSGTLNDPSGAPRLKGKLNARGGNFRNLMTTLDVGAPAWLAQPYSLDAEIDGSAKAIAVDGIALRLGDTNANGGINVVLGDKVQADVALRIGRVELDKILAREPAAAQPGRATAPPRPATPPATASGAAGFALPANLNGSLDLAIDAATYRDGRIRDIKFAAALSEGELTINQASARLPGGAEASLFGFLTTRSGKPVFDGSVDLRADNLRGLAGWLGFDVGAVPPDRLRKFTLTAKVKGEPGQVQATGIAMQLDASRFQGGVTYALGRDRPAFGARLSVDQLNLDAYTPAPSAGQPTEAAGDSRAGSAAQQPPSSGGAPLAALNAFDANLNLRIGTLNFRHTPIQGVHLDGTLMRGTLTIREARIGSLAGTAASIQGTLTGLDRLPAFKGGFAVDSQDITGLVRVAGIRTPVPPKQYGPLKFTGKADADADKLTIDSDLQFAGARATLDGTVAGLRQTPRFDLTLSATHPDLARLIPLVGAETRHKPGGLGIFGFSGRATGDIATVTLDTRMKAAGADLAFAGTVTQVATAAALNGKVELSHPSYAGFMRTLDPEFRPARDNLGPLRLGTEIKGDLKTIELASLRGEVGPMRLSGQGSLGLAGPRPKLTATVAADEVDLNTLLPVPVDGGAASRAPQSPAAVAGAPLAAVSGGGRFSRKPLDLSALDAMDADIRLAATTLLWRNFRVDGPQLAAALQDRVLTVSKLSGRMFEGSFDMTGRLSGAATPAFESKVRIARANVGKALFETGTFDIEGGIMDYDMTLAAKGKSQYDMIAALNGDGRIAVRDGVAKGFDLRALSDRLKNLDRATDILGLFGAAMGGGATRFSSLDGTFQIREGVLRSNDLKLVADAGAGTASGFVDMPRWNMDMVAEFRLVEHPKAPPFGMRVVGPPDRPRRLFKFEELQTYLLQRGIGRLLDRALGGQKQAPPATQPSAPQPAPVQPQPQEPQKIQPQDLLRGLLEGLQRR